MINQDLTRRISIAGAIAALYIVLTLGLSFMSFGSVQFRVSEILNLMAFLDPLYGAGVIVGCLVSNMFSPLGLPDVVFGTLATAIAVFAIARTKSLLLAAFWPVLANTIVAVELYYIIGLPLWYNIITVWIGEFAVAVCAGYPLFRLLARDARIMKILAPNKRPAR